MDGATATKALSESALEAKVLILTMHTEDEFLVPALEAGAAGYLVKSAADKELVAAVRTVAKGDPYLQAGAAHALAKEFKRRENGAAERNRFEELSNREKEILKLVASGYSAPEIGRQLSISPKTVDTYKQRINEKLGLHHRSEYVKFALKLKLLDS
ncbi:MAG: response regulator transcription factor [Gemmatimonadetes bacterium]|nr:response regulator transcription factor [Gemmatimonadota bacterium]